MNGGVAYEISIFVADEKTAEAKENINDRRAGKARHRRVRNAVFSQMFSSVSERKSCGSEKNGNGKGNYFWYGSHEK